MSLLSGIEDLGQEAVNGFTSLGGLLGIGSQPKTSPLLATPQVQSQDLPPLNQPQPAAPPTPPEQQGFVSTLLANPALADALGRMSGNLAEASAKGYNTGAGLGYGFSGFNQGWDDYANRKAALAKTGADANLANAQAGLAAAQGQVAKLRQGLPAQGTDAQSDAINQLYRRNLQAGQSQQDAAFNAVAAVQNQVHGKPTVYTDAQGNAHVMMAPQITDPLHPAAQAAPGVASSVNQPVAGAPAAAAPAPLAPVPQPNATSSAAPPLGTPNATNEFGKKAAGNLADAATPDVNDNPVQTLTDAIGLVNRAKNLSSQAPGGYVQGPLLQARGRLLGDQNMSQSDQDKRDAYSQLGAAKDLLVTTMSKGTFPGNRMTNMMMQQLQNAKGFDTDMTQQERGAILNQLGDILSLRRDEIGAQQTAAQQGKTFSESDLKNFYAQRGYDYSTGLPTSANAQQSPASQQSQQQSALTNLTALPAGYTQLANGKVRGPDGQTYRMMPR